MSDTNKGWKQGAKRVLPWLLLAISLGGLGYGGFKYMKNDADWRVKEAHWEGDRQFLEGEVNRPKETPSPSLPLRQS